MLSIQRASRNQKSTKNSANCTPLTVTAVFRSCVPNRSNNGIQIASAIFRNAATIGDAWRTRFMPGKNPSESSV